MWNEAVLGLVEYLYTIFRIHESSKSPYNASTLCGECHKLLIIKSTFGVK